MKTSQVIWLILFFIVSSAISAQEHQHNSQTNIEKNKSKMEVKIVREGVINLKAIDKNKDGKVYQDQMDWNVISDQPGKCPICKMTLKEVTLEEAKKNLIKHEFKVK
jgi:Cu(I)/Ag(I) efflux system membrane fusion protein/cobalt-zinc-cadmium efflux system membrane fusion protein